MINQLEVRRRPGDKPHDGLFVFGSTAIPCSLGRSGITTRKREGDGATPTGTFRLLYGFYRGDKIMLPPTTLPMAGIEHLDGWCDEPLDPNYNRLIRLPFPHSHEIMWRDDRLYDICIVLDYNISPRKRNAGSAIFFHLTKPDLGPTEGCVAIDPEAMRLLLPKLSPDTILTVHP